ncbi:MAG: hypothetical protein QXL43_02830, partial [Methanolinea sp.]
EMTPREMGETVLVPRPSAWKFGAALPAAFLREMAAYDLWQVEEFAREFRDLPLYLVPPPGAGQAPCAPPPGGPAPLTPRVS